MRWRWTCTDYVRWIEMCGKIQDTWCIERTHGSGCEYNEWGNIECFGNPIVVSNFIFYNILYVMVEFLIHGYKYDWWNNVRTSCTFVWIVLS